VLALYFADSMNFEMRAADNRVAAIEAEHAINGAARYVTYILTKYGTNGTIPNLRDYSSENVPVGDDASFWLIGRGIPRPPPQERGVRSGGRGLQAQSQHRHRDDAGILPGMTVEFAAAIIDWRDTDSEPVANGAEDDVYQRLNPPRRCKTPPSSRLRNSGWFTEPRPNWWMERI